MSCGTYGLINLTPFRLELWHTPTTSLQRGKTPHNCYIIAEGFFLYYPFSLVISYHSVWLSLELFGLVHVQVHTLSAINARARRM